MTSSIHQLFGEAAARYDLHTPPRHYQHDHQFVLNELLGMGSSLRVLDVGCGTGVFIQFAREAGLDVYGADISPDMVTVAETRLGRGIVRVERMQDLEDTQAYDALVCLSWSFHYCASAEEAKDVLSRFLRALRPGGMLILQAAHAAHATGHLLEDWEPGPSGEPNDIQFLYRFSPLVGAEPMLRAQYVFTCRSLDELVAEDHLLSTADAGLVVELAQAAGFANLRIYESWRKEPFSSSVSPFLVAVRPVAT